MLRISRCAPTFAAIGWLFMTSSAPTSGAAPAGYRLAWADEFDGDSLDVSKWLYRADFKQQSIQLPSNVSVSDGSLLLSLQPLATPINGFTATGAGVITRRQFRYGYYETRARLGDGIDDDRDGRTDEGWWHAFWAMAAEANPDGTVSTTFPSIRRTEIDGFENGSNNLSQFTSHIIQWSPQGTITAVLPEDDRHTIPAAQIYDWHTYGFEWTPNEVNFFFNNTLVGTAIYPATVYEQSDVNVWLTAISTTDQGPGQERSQARYDYFRYYAPSGTVGPRESFAIGADQLLAGPVGGTRVSSAFGSVTAPSSFVASDLRAQSGSIVQGTGVLLGALRAQSGSTVRVGRQGLNVGTATGILTRQDFESFAPGVAFANGAATGLIPNWTFYDLGASKTDARFLISGADGTATQPSDPALRGESRMLFQATTAIDFATTPTGTPLAGALAISNEFNTSGVVDVIEADFVLDGYRDDSAQNLDTRLVFGFRDISNWFALGLVAGGSDGSGAQLYLSAITNGLREDIFSRSGTSFFTGGFPEDELLRARVVHDKSQGYVQFSISLTNSGEVLASSYVTHDRFKAGGKIGFGTNNDATGFDNFSVSTLDRIPDSLIQTLTIEGDYVQEEASTLEVDLASANVYDRLTVTGNASLAGLLSINAIESANLPLGAMATLLVAGGGATGRFDSVAFPVLGNHRAMRLVYGPAGVSTQIVLAGDFNSDGVVNAADYTVWRDLLGSQVDAGTGADLSGDGRIGNEEYLVWRANFGATAAGPIALLMIPEPTTATLFAFGVLIGLASQRVTPR